MSLTVFALCIATIAVPRTSAAQRPLLGLVPTTQLPDSDFKNLRWVEGTWRGDAVGTAEPPFFERYTFLDDSLIQVTFYSDSTLRREIGGGRIYHNGGRVFEEAGSARWVAVRMRPGEALFIPDRNAPNRIRWQLNGPDQWLVTIRSSMSGSERIRMYQMHRIH
jgi:hypothetical protein